MFMFAEGRLPEPRTGPFVTVLKRRQIKLLNALLSRYEQRLCSGGGRLPETKTVNFNGKRRTEV